MTSLFHRTVSRSHGTSSHRSARGGAQLNNNSATTRPRRVVHRLEFNQAMGDFRTMFPGVERQVIECVLWANNGVVEATIEQLLQMSISGQATDDSSDSEDSIPPEVSERSKVKAITLHLTNKWMSLDVFFFLFTMFVECQCQLFPENPHLPSVGWVLFWVMLSGAAPVKPHAYPH